MCRNLKLDRPAVPSSGHDVTTAARGKALVTVRQSTAQLWSACLPRSSTEPTSNVSSCPPGGAMSGMEPTVDSVVAQPLPAYWYYVLAGVGAILLLVTGTVVVILCCHRYHWATKKTSSSGHHHSVMYQSGQHSNQQAQQNCYQNQNLSYNLIHSPDQSHLYPGPGPGPDPMLTIRLEKDDSYGSRC
ncbi:unnamed protein product [Pleuronectes platessa]|uniref:Uncharacterized protein n=1 Tax=Pleuronectes platessa TaxID=8262 RepID=A0A9N7TGW2_PLEPL|nr:unnamed protein product [Pleuronectes platessa]